jgi:hypothetical protein
VFKKEKKGIGHNNKNFLGLVPLISIGVCDVDLGAAHVGPHWRGRRWKKPTSDKFDHRQDQPSSWPQTENVNPKYGRSQAYKNNPK